jgi:hypothetical protein
MSVETEVEPDIRAEVRSRDIADLAERRHGYDGCPRLARAMLDHWDAHGDCDRLHTERFQPKLGLAEEGEGGTIVFATSDKEVECGGSTPILVAGENDGLELPFGCRGGGDGPHVHLRARGAHRHRAVREKRGSRARSRG